MGSYRRELVLDLPERQSAFLWGPRKTGKSTFLAERFPGSARFDLLETRTALDFTREPWLFTERGTRSSSDPGGLAAGRDERLLAGPPSRHRARRSPARS